MKQYSIYKADSYIKGEDIDFEVFAVKEGLYWSGFVFSSLWLHYYNFKLGFFKNPSLIIPLYASGIVPTVFAWYFTNESTPIELSMFYFLISYIIFNFILSFYLLFKGNKILKSSLKNRQFTFKKVVTAANSSAAIALFASDNYGVEHDKISRKDR